MAWSLQILFLPAAPCDVEDLRTSGHDPHAVARGIERQSAAAQRQPHTRVAEVPFANHSEVRREIERLELAGPDQQPQSRRADVRNVYENMTAGVGREHGDRLVRLIPALDEAAR